MNRRLLVMVFLCQLLLTSVGKSFASAITEDTVKFRPSLQFGGLLQVQGLAIQDRPDDPLLDNDRDWAKQLQIWRARFMIGGAISRKTSFFMQTELPAPLGFVSDSVKHIQSISPIILDAQIEHALNRYVTVIAGMQLVGISRNGLQSPVTLMGLDFGWYQYPYNLLESQPLQNNFGRDIGINTRGFLAHDRFEWRVGVFRGRGISEYSPLRTAIRVNYNFLDKEKGLYYSGTTLGKYKLLSLGGGIDKQGSYLSTAVDAFLDLPINNVTSLTWQGSYMHLDGGNSNGRNSFSHLIPRQNIFFTELGFYFMRTKLQPYVKYEMQRSDITKQQYSVNAQRISMGLGEEVSKANLSEFNTLTSNSRFGVGINYFVNEFNFHVKAQYEQVYYGRLGDNGNAETRNGGEVKLQLTYFIFQ